MSRWPYSTQRWQRLRRAKLRENSLCQACLEVGLIEVATTVDHVQPIRAGGDPYSTRRFRSRCAPCHSKKTRHIEQLGRKEVPKVWGCDIHGMPFYLNHAWNKERNGKS